MIVIITDESDTDSTGLPMDWYDAVLTAKAGIPENVVVLSLINTPGGVINLGNDTGSGQAFRDITATAAQAEIGGNITVTGDMDFGAVTNSNISVDGTYTSTGGGDITFGNIDDRTAGVDTVVDVMWALEAEDLPSGLRYWRL